MITNYEIGWYRCQIRYDENGYAFRLYQIGSVQMELLNLDKAKFISITGDRVEFRIGIISYVLTFSDYQPSIEKTRFTAKLFHSIPVRASLRFQINQK